jgi:hypothetical protein
VEHRPGVELTLLDRADLGHPIGERLPSRRARTTTFGWFSVALAAGSRDEAMAATQIWMLDVAPLVK